MSELDDIRKRKIEELKKAQASNQSGEGKISQQIEQLEAAIKPLLTKEALARYGTIKAAYPEKAVQVLLVLGQAAQRGQISLVTDDLLKKILIQLTPKKRDTQIRGI